MEHMFQAAVRLTTEGTLLASRRYFGRTCQNFAHKLSIVLLLRFSDNVIYSFERNFFCVYHLGSSHLCRWKKTKEEAVDEWRTRREDSLYL